MLPYLAEEFGNPSSAHWYGRRARAALDDAHERFAHALHAEPREIVFTSGGTEANNLALKGAAWAGRGRGPSHRDDGRGAPRRACTRCATSRSSASRSWSCRSTATAGSIPTQVDAAITDKTILVSVMYANNEVGTIQPIPEIARRVAAHRGVLLHVDAVQAAAHVDLDLDSPRRRPGLVRGPQVRGSQGRRRAVRPPRDAHPRPAAGRLPGAPSSRRDGERRRRGRDGAAPTSWPSLERAETVAPAAPPARPPARRAVLAVEGTELTGHPRDRLPGHLSLIAREVDGTAVALALDLEGIAASVGSACATGSTEVSHVLTAMGFPEDEARGSLRLSLGRITTDAEVERGGRDRPADARRAARRLGGRGRRSARPGRPA